MPPKKPGLMVRVWAHIVLTYGKVHTFVSDCYMCTKLFFGHYGSMLKRIWVGFEFRNLFSCLKLSIGAVVYAYQMAKNEFMKGHRERIALMIDHIESGMPQGFFEQAKAYTV